MPEISIQKQCAGLTNLADEESFGAPIGDLSIDKNDGVATYTPGGQLSYTIVVGNAGPSVMYGAVVSDAVAGLPQVVGASWICSAAGGATCTAGPVNGDLAYSADIPLVGTATETLTDATDMRSCSMVNCAATGNLA